MAPPTHDEKIPKHDAPASNQDKNSPRATRRVGGRPTTYNGPDGCGDESGATLLGDSIQEGPSPRRDRAHHRRSVSPSLRRWLQDEDEEPFRASVMPAAISQFHGGTQNMPGPLAWEPQTGQQGADSDSGLVDLIRASPVVCR